MREFAENGSYFAVQIEDSGDHIRIDQDKDFVCLSKDHIRPMLRYIAGLAGLRVVSADEAAAPVNKLDPEKVESLLLEVQDSATLVAESKQTLDRSRDSLFAAHRAVREYLESQGLMGEEDGDE